VQKTNLNLVILRVETSDTLADWISKISGTVHFDQLTKKKNK
jgi:hypothetical protein